MAQVSTKGSWMDHNEMLKTKGRPGQITRVIEKKRSTSKNVKGGKDPRLAGGRRLTRGGDNLNR